MSNRLFSEDKFDKHFTSVEKTVSRTFAAIIVMWILGALLSLALTGGLIYVAIHFISKYW